MRKIFLKFSLSLGIIVILFFSACSKGDLLLGELSSGAKISATQDTKNNWIILGKSGDASSFKFQYPITIDIIDSTFKIHHYKFGYQQVKNLNSGFKASAHIKIPGKGSISIKDIWTMTFL